MKRPSSLGGYQVMPLTPVVKVVLIISAAIWFFGVVVAEQYFFSKPYLTYGLGLVPIELVHHFHVWQLVTYLFIHASNPLHILFNMLLLWWLGGELEQLWGSKTFAFFYFACGISAAALYTAAIYIYVLATGHIEPLLVPVIGASAAVFGLLVAYGVLFGDRVVYFMFLFPLQAKWFVWILAALEVVLILNNGFAQGKVASLAHIGGLISGFIILRLMAYWNRRRRDGGGKKNRRSSSGHLKLVVNNEDEQSNHPRYWN